MTVCLVNRFNLIEPFCIHIHVESILSCLGKSTYGKNINSWWNSLLLCCTLLFTILRNHCLMFYSFCSLETKQLVPFAWQPLLLSTHTIYIASYEYFFFRFTAHLCFVSTKINPIVDGIPKNNQQNAKEYHYESKNPNELTPN